MYRPFTLLLALGLVVTACRNPDVREEPIVDPPDTAAVDEPLIDPGVTDPRWDPGRAQPADELEARRTILRDPTVQEAQVFRMGVDTVHVVAVLAEPGITDVELKAEQFTITAVRHMERPPLSPGDDPLAPARLTYLVTVYDPEGTVVYAARKLPGQPELTREQTAE